MGFNKTKIIYGALFLAVLWLVACSSGGSTSLSTGKAWGTAAVIETGNGDAYAPQVAFDTSGNALVVWEQFDGTSQSIYANRYGASSGVWAAPTLIDNLPGTANRPQIAIDPSGNALTVWYQSDGANNRIYASHYLASNNIWGAAAPIENTSGNALDPQIGIDSSGNALAVWYQFDGANNSIYANRYTSLAGWGATPVLISNAANSAIGPQIAVAPNGNALVVWYQYDGSVNNIWANRYTASNDTWGVATLIETGTGSAEVPQIAIDANGNGLAVWQQNDGSQYSIMANRYDAFFNSWGTAGTIETDNSGPAARPHVAIDSNGNALAVWQQNTAAGVNIWANRFTAGINTWGIPVLVENVNTGTADYPRVAFDTAGNALAVWQKNDGTRNNIWSNLYSVGYGTWGTAGLIETDNAGAAETPQVAIDANGNALAVWDQSDGTRFNIWANRFH